MIAIAIAYLGCAGPTGELVVQLDAEDTITSGLDPGTGLDNVVDGWTVRYQHFRLAIGNVAIARSDTMQSGREDGVHVVDLTALPATGFVLARLPGLSSGRWNQLGYELPHASAQDERADSVSRADFDAMVAGGLTYWIEGTIENGAARVDFSLPVPIATSYRDCAAEDGLAGAVVPTSGSATVSATIHGDHLFFNAFPTASEIVERRAQWLADADADGDGHVTQAELMSAQAAVLFPSARYNLANAPVPIRTGWDFVRAQLATQGHFQGEGDCIWTVEP